MYKKFRIKIGKIRHCGQSIVITKMYDNKIISKCTTIYLLPHPLCHLPPPEMAINLLIHETMHVILSDESIIANEQWDNIVSEFCYCPCRKKAFIR
ncbi:MAG: hypothetical protein A2W22_01900 [Candidatus Levybacteria bacterium RBG_16_35_11]|nr:MAG: hypothetical protein A2W22_01900 [Candidatus Levybacteria bacterium RBG_16_35_11]